MHFADGVDFCVLFGFQNNQWQ